MTRTTPLTDSGVEVVENKYYRYWEGTYNATTNPGHPYAIKYIVDYEGTRRQDWEDSTFDDDYLSLSDSALEDYASAYFEYDSSHRIDLAWFDGECGCGTGGINGTHEFTYGSNGSFSDDTGAYDSEWKTRTIVERPDAAYLTQYYDEAHQALTRVLTDSDPASSPDNTWVWHPYRNDEGVVHQYATPASITSYNHNSGAVSVATTTGLYYKYTRLSTGAMKSFMAQRKFQKGTAQLDAWMEGRWIYGQIDLAVGDSDVVRPTMTATHRYPTKTTSASNSDVTNYTITAYSGELAIEKIKTEDPAVSTSKNGSGTRNEETTYYRKDGSVAFVDSRGGIIAYTEYTDGVLTESIEDADTTETADFDITVPSGLSSDSGAHHRATTYTYDDQGRREETTRANGRVLKSYYSKLADRRRVVLGYNDYETSPSTKFFGPVSYSVLNHAGKSDARATVALTSNESTSALTAHVDETDDDPITAMDLGSVVRLTTSHYNETGGTLEETRLYFDVPASGTGADGTNYDPIFYAYDDNGRQVRVKEASGTIRYTGYDLHGHVTNRWIGTNDSSFDPGEPSGTDNMVKTEALEYDDGNDGGNGYLTKQTLYVEATATDKRETTYDNDLRGRALLETRPESPHGFHKYNNMGQVLATGLFSSTASISVNSDDPTNETTNRLALNQTAYDELGRAWKTTRHKIDASDGSDDDSLDYEYWRDEEGRTIKQDADDLAKTFYDRFGRVSHRFDLAEDNDTAYGDADDVSGDHVLGERQSHYEDDGDELIMSVLIQREHDDWGAGETTGALDSNADSDDLLLTAANVSGRPQITAFWYDQFGRRTDAVRYGTYGGSNFDRDGLSVPARSDTALRTSYSYGTDGPTQEVTDPRDLARRTEYDDAGRVSKVVRNYDASVNSGNPSGTDDNQTVKYEYTDGLQTKLTADLPSGQTDQDTTYTYGTTGGGATGDSDIATGHLLQEVKYPDSGGASDVVTYAYNAQSEEIYRKDQAGNVFERDLDDAGREEHRRVTTLATGFDGAVRRISTTYDSLSRPDLVTQYDNATVGSGSVVDEVKYSYDGWGNVTKFEQDRNSAVGASGSVDDYEVSYSYAKATTGRNTIRRSDTTLPSGNVITIDYSLDKDGSASRVSKLIDGSTTLVEYDYLGSGRVVGETYQEPEVFSRWFTTSGYHNVDRFNRVTADLWSMDIATPEHFYNIDLSCDRNSNITLAEDNVHPGFDVSYSMDDLDRLIDAQEGTWNGSSITSETRQQEWTLDHTGNWDLAKLDLNGDGDWGDADEYQDDRTHNAVNELTARDTDDDDTDDYTLTYDAVGNLTDDGENYKYRYDAYGRLRKVMERVGETLVAEYRYNGLGFQMGRLEDTDDDGDADSNDLWFYTAYDEGWRVLARFREDDSDPKEEFVNQLAGRDGSGRSSYINGVVARDKDEDTAWTSESDGVLEQRFYYCHNWRGDVVVISDDSGALVEWVKYSAYGVPFGLPGADTDSDGDCLAADGDIDQIQAWMDAPTYDVRGDVDLDGDLDSTDKTIASNWLDGKQMGWEVLTDEGNRCGYGGYVLKGTLAAAAYRARHRNLSSSLGRWLRRDPLGYADGVSSYEYGRGRSVIATDPTGLLVWISCNPSNYTNGEEMCFYEPNCPECNEPGMPDDPVEYQEEESGEDPLTPEEEQACCDHARSEAGPNASGETLCCGKHKVSCVFAPTGPPGSPTQQAYECFKAHEEKHKASTLTTCDTCTAPNGLTCLPTLSPNTSAGKVHEEHARIYNEEIQCLEGIQCPGRKTSTLGFMFCVLGRQYQICRSKGLEAYYSCLRNSLPHYCEEQQEAAERNCYLNASTNAAPAEGLK